MKNNDNPKIWGVFVGERGDQLAAFNSNDGPFPPKPNAMGYVAIGWAKVGDMTMYAGDYNDFRKKFAIVYPNNDERVLSTQANRVWSFAFEIKNGDFVICPSSTFGCLLVGNIVDGYMSDYDNWESVAKTKTRADLLHLRRVRWICAINNDDHRYAKLHRIGQLAVVNIDMSTEELESILNSKD